MIDLVAAYELGYDDEMWLWPRDVSHMPSEWQAEYRRDVEAASRDRYYEHG